MNNQEIDPNIAEGIVIEALPEAMFKVLINEDEDAILAYLAGKMRINRIKVLVGDKVEMKMDPYGGKARIFKRL
jgi:translation initiation factor IF-1